MYGFFKLYRSSGTVLGTVHAVRGRIEDGTAYYWSAQPCSHRTVRMNGPDLILKFLIRINGTEWCRICGTVKKNVRVKRVLLWFSYWFLLIFQSLFFFRVQKWKKFKNQRGTGVLTGTSRSAVDSSLIKYVNKSHYHYFLIIYYFNLVYRLKWVKSGLFTTRSMIVADCILKVTALLEVNQVTIMWVPVHSCIQQNETSTG